MTSRDFCFWLQGYFEISKADGLNSEQVATIKKHLELAFVHDIDPSMGDEQHQGKLNKVHGGKGPSGLMRC